MHRRCRAQTPSLHHADGAASGLLWCHDAAFYTDTLRQILDAGIPYDAVCFKDASGTAVPAKSMRPSPRRVSCCPEDTFIHFHTHETAGIGVSANMAALDAGADAIDLSMAPCSGGTCQPDIIVMWHALRGSDYDLDIDIDKIRDTEEVFKECMADYFLPPEAVAVEPMIPWSPMPGGALTANTQMLRDNGIMDKYPDMIKAMREVVEKGGFGTSVTPVSQFYFQQAFNNVMFGPWERIAAPYGQMVLGLLRQDTGRARPLSRRDRRPTARARANDPKSTRTQRRRPKQGRRTGPQTTAGSWPCRDGRKHFHRRHLPRQGPRLPQGRRRNRRAQGGAKAKGRSPGRRSGALCDHR